MLTWPGSRPVMRKVLVDPSALRRSSSRSSISMMMSISLVTLKVRPPSLMTAPVTWMRSSGKASTWLAENSCGGITAKARSTVSSLIDAAMLSAASASMTTFCPSSVWPVTDMASALEI